MLFEVLSFWAMVQRQKECHHCSAVRLNYTLFSMTILKLPFTIYLGSLCPLMLLRPDHCHCLPQKICCEDFLGVLKFQKIFTLPSNYDLIFHLQSLSCSISHAPSTLQFLFSNSVPRLMPYAQVRCTFSYPYLSNSSCLSRQRSKIFQTLFKWS